RKLRRSRNCPAFEPRNLVRLFGRDLQRDPRHLVRGSLLYQRHNFRRRSIFDLLQVEAAGALTKIEVARDTRRPRRKLSLQKSAVSLTAAVECLEPGGKLLASSGIGSLRLRRANHRRQQKKQRENDCFRTHNPQTGELG